MPRATGPLIDGRQQVHGPAEAVPGAAERFAIHGHREGAIAVGKFAQDVGDPAGQNLLERVNIDLDQGPSVDRWRSAESDGTVVDARNQLAVRAEIR